MKKNTIKDKGAVDGCSNGTGNGVDEIKSSDFKGG